MIVVVFQSHDALASPPSPSDFNHALSVNGGSAVASGYSGTNTPANAIDGNSSTYWESSGTVGSLSVQFRAMSYVNEVHAHFRTTVYSYLSLYLDTSGNGAYETGERVWTTTKNGILDVVPPLTGPYRALGMRISIDLKNGSAHPKINEFEAYLRGDADGDGLSSAQEAATTYFQDVRPGGLPQAIPDDGVNVSTSSVSLAAFSAVPVRALANFTVDHSRPADLTSAVGYWNGTAWVDRYVWDHAGRFAGIGIASPDAVRSWEGLVPVVAVVGSPEATAKVEFRVDGILQATVTTPVGSEYRWTWNTTSLGDRRSTLNVTQYDAVAARAWSQIVVKVNNLAPTANWVSPPHLSTQKDVVTLNASASDFYGIQRVRFYADGVSLGDGVPKGGGYFTIAWDTTAYCSNGDHAISATATENTATAKSTTVFAQLFTNNDPLVCITSPAAGGTVSGTAYPVRASTVSALGITKVEFLVEVPPFPATPQLRFTDTAAPWEWAWDTTRDPNGPVRLWAKAYNMQGKVDVHVIQVNVINAQCTFGCFGPATGSMEASSAESSEPTATLGVLAAEWSVGETTSGSRTTVVSDLSVVPVTLFLSNLQWRLVLRDWSAGVAGNVTAFTLRFEVRSDPLAIDTDGDGIRDGTEANYWRTLPVARDSDLDGLADGYEIVGHSLTVRTDGVTKIWTNITSDPTKWDTDGDDLGDGQERGVVTTGQSKVIGEVGRVTGITGSCSSPGPTTVYLRNRYTSADVIPQPATKNEADTGVVRVKAVGDHSFDACFQEWSGSSTHAAESVDYLVLEAGNHILPDGTVVEAGKVSAGTAFSTFPFREWFGGPPIVIAQIQSYADPDVAAARVRSPTFAGFDARIRVNAGDTHPAETVGYVAIAPQSDASALATWTRGSVAVGAAANPATVAFPKNFTAAPRFLAWYATEGSTADLSLRIEVNGLTNASATLRREISGTSGAETLHWFAFAGSMNLTARMTTRPNGTGSTDTDGDTLSDGVEVNTYGSNPSLKDSDADGIPDNVEVTDRTITIPVNGTMKSFTFKTSPTSDDTDADGIKDPDELNGILDHRILFYDMATTTDSSHLRDLSGNGFVGTISGAIDGGGKVGRARYFGGSSYVQTAASPWLNPSAITVAAWVFLDSSPTPNGPIVAKGQSFTDFQYSVEIRKNGTANSAPYKVNLQLMTASGGTVSIFSTASIAKGGAWRHIAFTYDGAAVRLYIDGALDKGPVPLSGSLRMTAYDLSVGSFAATSTKFKGSLDEIQIWDRSLSLSEIGAYFNVTNAGSPVAWLDMEHRDEINQLVDFSGANHPGIVYGTTVVEGRKGFGRKLAGPSDGIAISGTSDATFFATAVSADVYVLVSSMPVSDVSLVARTSQFYLNLTSDGRLQWSLYKAGTVTSPLPIPLNRWVRATGTAAKNGTTASTLSLYVDGTAVSSSNSGAYPTSSSVVTVGYTERTPEVRLKGSLDELLLMGTAASPSTVRGLGARGILLNPNATDTDGDGLADGQESSVITVRTPKRYPVPDQQWMLSDPMTLSLSAPGWALQSATLMTGFTHPDMCQIGAKIFHNAPSPWSRLVTLRYYGNVGQANNFTSYDLLNLGFARDEFVAGGTWSANVYDKTAGGRGQIEYYQIQLTMHTLPNRADTDSDGLNDSEEVGLGHDGYLTNPWKADTDGDGILDGVEANGWSWRVSDWTMVNDSTGFRTDPTNPDTDRDGTPDGRDGNPLADL